MNICEVQQYFCHDLCPQVYYKITAAENNFI